MVINACYVILLNARYGKEYSFVLKHPLHESDFLCLLQRQESFSIILN